MKTIVSVVVATMLAGTAAGAAAPLFHAQGEMAGEPTQTSVILQSRLTAAQGLRDGDVPGATGWACFELSREAGFQEACQTEWMEATADRDFIVKVKVTGLQPGTKYYYRLNFGPTRESAQPGPARSFKTLPATVAETPVKFVMANCMNYAFFHRGPNDTGEGAAPEADRKLGYPAMEAIRKLQPDFFVGAGDNVYYDHPKTKPARTQEEMRRKWHEQFVQPRVVTLFGDVPAFWLKDDHDYRYNDADTTGDRPPTHALGVRTFLEQLPVVDPLEKRPLTYRTHRVNKFLQIWMLEGRDYRSPNAMPDGPRKTIWGPDQKAWLMQTLRNSDATFKLIISPTPMVGPDDAKKSDNHTNPGGFRYEGDAFFAWLRERNLRNVFILRGDRHWQYHSVHPIGYEEFCCGALHDENSRLGPKPGDPNSTDPQGLVKQLYAQKEKSGGFLQVGVTSDRTLEISFYDDRGTLLHKVVRPATPPTPAAFPPPPKPATPQPAAKPAPPATPKSAPKAATPASAPKPSASAGPSKPAAPAKK
ncbi:MAG: alkaline phosphatase D family protein [Verrucomicrobiae bacterium]|nr:alkaline phosphatase D family protein [Verrucomicrobiae bacterium]